MKTSYEYEMEIFVSKRMGFGYILETVLTSAYRYSVKITRFDPDGKVVDRVYWLKSTLDGVTFNECCDKIATFKTNYA